LASVDVLIARRRFRRPLDLVDERRPSLKGREATFRTRDLVRVAGPV